MNIQLLPDLKDEAQVIVWNQYIDLINGLKATKSSQVFNPKLDRLKTFLKSIKSDLASGSIGLQAAYDMIQDCVTSYKKGWYC